MEEAVKFQSYSQAGQDQWVYDTLVKAYALKKGTFLDIGCNHPIEISNTYGLEQIGWEGVMMDNDPHCFALCHAQRKGLVIMADSTKIAFDVVGRKHFNYLSLDVDSATLDTLRGLLRDGISWDVATIEHDSYRFGPGPRDAMRELLSKGYNLARADVQCGGEPFEDWWIAKKENLYGT